MLTNDLTNNCDLSLLFALNFYFIYISKVSCNLSGNYNLRQNTANANISAAFMVRVNLLFLNSVARQSLLDGCAA